MPQQVSGQSDLICTPHGELENLAFPYNFKTSKFDFYKDMLNFQVPRGGCKSNRIDLKLDKVSYNTIYNTQKKVRLILRRLGELQHPNIGSILGIKYLYFQYYDITGLLITSRKIFKYLYYWLI